MQQKKKKILLTSTACGKRKECKGNNKFKRVQSFLRFLKSLKICNRSLQIK